MKGMSLRKEPLESLQNRVKMLLVQHLFLKLFIAN